jgi:methyltransferase
MVSSVWAYLAFLGALGLERLFELRLSKRNAAWVLAQGGREHGAGHFRVMALMHTAFLFACAAEVVLLRRPFVPAIGLPALVVALAAQGLRYWAISTLGKRWNVRIIVLPDAEPVTGGPYRYLRHPNYVAVVLELAAVPLIHGAWLTAVLFSLANAAVLFVRIRAEEEALGSRYARAFADKPRFLPSPGGTQTDGHR